MLIYPITIFMSNPEASEGIIYDDFPSSDDSSRFQVSTIIEQDISNIQDLLARCGGIIRHKKVFGSFQLPHLIRNSPYAIQATSNNGGNSNTPTSPTSIGGFENSGLQQSQSESHGFLFLSDQPATGDFVKFMNFLNAG